MSQPTTSGYDVLQALKDMITRDDAHGRAIGSLERKLDALIVATSSLAPKSEVSHIENLNSGVPLTLHRQGRRYLLAYSPVFIDNCVLNIIGLANYTMGIMAGWNVLEVPDGSTLTGPSTTNQSILVVQSDNVPVSGTMIVATTDGISINSASIEALALYNGTTFDRARSLNTSNAVAPTGIQAVGPYFFNGATFDPGRSAQYGDGQNGGGTGAVNTFTYNGSSYDRFRGNQDGVSLISASGVTTTQTSADQKNYNGRGVIVILDMTTVGTGSVTLEIDLKDPISGKYVALLTGAAVTTNTTNIYTVYPGAAVVANVSASLPLPRTWRVKVTANNANAASYTVGASVIL